MPYSDTKLAEKATRDKDIVELYVNHHLSMENVGRLHNLSRQAVKKILNRAGVDTSKTAACWVDTTCASCENPIRVRRARYRTNIRNFCGDDCYHDWIRHNGNCQYIPNRRGCMRARAVVEQAIGEKPPDGSVVHHADGNNYNNALWNLMLFRSHADHLRWHRGDKSLVDPLWSGADNK